MVRVLVSWQLSYDYIICVTNGYMLPNLCHHLRRSGGYAQDLPSSGLISAGNSHPPRSGLGKFADADRDAGG